MKSWHVGLFSVLFCLSGSTIFAGDTSPADTIVKTPEVQTVSKEAASPAPTVIDPSLHMKNLDDYYITEGDTYTKVTDLLESLPKDQTGLSSDGNHYFRVYKKLTSDFFYHVSAYNQSTHVLEGNYFVAKDQSCAWKLKENSDAVLLCGNGESLLKKTKVVFYPKKMTVGSYGIVRVHVPGMLPYDVKITSLNTDVASITDKMNIKPLRQGTADIVVDVSVAGSSRTFTEQIDVIDKDNSDNSDSSYHPSVGIGIGIGWGGGWHHHGGGIGIGVGPWW